MLKNKTSNMDVQATEQEVGSLGAGRGMLMSLGWSRSNLSPRVPPTTTTASGQQEPFWLL